MSLGEARRLTKGYRRHTDAVNKGKK